MTFVAIGALRVKPDQIEYIYIMYYTSPQSLAICVQLVACVFKQSGKQSRSRSDGHTLYAF